MTIDFDVFGLLLSVLGALLIAYCALSVRSSYELQQDIDGPTGFLPRFQAVLARYDISMGFGYIAAGMALQAVGSLGSPNPAVGAFAMLAGVFIYMIYLGERQQLAQGAVDAYEKRKNR
jgi:hypothetical protein